MQQWELARTCVFRLAEIEPVWRHVLNRRSTREYRHYRPKLCGEAARMLTSLNETGLAISHVERLEGMAESFEALRRVALETETCLLRQRNQRRLGGPQAKGYSMTSNLLGSYPLMEPDSVFARFTTQLALLEVVNAYFGMFAQLRKYAVFRTRDVQEGVNAKWHRDAPFNSPIIRVFAYFTDITAANGAFLYAAGTHWKSKRGSKCRIADEILDERAVACAGPAGTLVLADTRGYHKAGRFLGGERWLYNSVFTSPGFGQDFFTRAKQLAPRRMEPVSWALSSPLTLRRSLFG